MKEFVKQKIVLHYFSLKDTKTSFCPPFVFETIEDAKRGIAQLFVKALKNDNGQKLADSELYYIGDFDLETGKFTSELTKICDVKDLIQYTGNPVIEGISKEVSKQLNSEAAANGKSN